ncbi:hypothetical protein LCGC14_1464570, partial [marine sediment metagenome]
DYKIKNYNYSTYYLSALKICSYRMVEDLARHGIMKNKTKILKRPNIDEKYYRHWIRGLFDGDGSISMTKKRKLLYLHKVWQYEEFPKELQEQKLLIEVENRTLVTFLNKDLILLNFVILILGLL